LGLGWPQPKLDPENEKKELIGKKKGEGWEEIQPYLRL
jgi:hypothetical protein